VLNAGEGGDGAERGFGGGGRGSAPGSNPNGGAGQNVTPNAVPLRIQPFDPAAGMESAERPAAEETARLRETSGPSGGGRGGAGGSDDGRARVVLQFSANPNDQLLSGTLANGQLLANRAAALDQRLGTGHVVMFAIRPFWRWQTQGTYTLGFNAIMNWNDLDAGREQARRPSTSQR